MKTNNKDHKEVRDDQEKNTTTQDKRRNRTKYTKSKSGKHGDGIPKKNDWHFYAVDDAMARDVANIPFNYISGTPAPFLSRKPSGIANVDLTDGVSYLPSVLVVNYVPGPGTSHTLNSGINMAARQIYSYIRRANSGARNYESPDLMLYILAMEQIYLSYFELRRVYALANTYFYMNRNLPDTILRSLGFNPGEVRGSLAEYRYKLGLLRLKINSMAVPAGFTSFARRAFVGSQLFTDSDDLRGQFYVLRSEGTFKFNPTKYNTGGALSYQSYGTNNYISTRLSTLDSQIEALIGDDDMNTMSGDIIKAYGMNGLYSVPDVPEDLTITPMFDTDVLSQIENSRSVILDDQNKVNVRGGGVDYDAMDIFQQDGMLIWCPLAMGRYDKVNTPNGLRNVLTAITTPIVNSHIKDPKPTDVLEWTRLATLTTDGLPTGFQAAVDDEGYSTVECGLELVTSYTIVWPNPDVVSKIGTKELHSSVTWLSNNNSAVIPIITALNALSQFDWHPRVQAFSYYIADTVSGLDSYDVIRPFPINMDLKCATFVDTETIVRMHSAANYSVYYTKVSS